MNKYTQDMTGTGQYVELPDSEPERYYDWMLWKLRQSPEWKKAIYGEPSFKDSNNFIGVTSIIRLDYLTNPYHTGYLVGTGWNRMTVKQIKKIV